MSKQTKTPTKITIKIKQQQNLEDNIHPKTDYAWGTERAS